jgi:putative membrane protein
MSLVEPAPKDRGTVLAEERTDLAFQRTIIAAERTLMAWIRTALSMIGFGFTIYKFFQYQAEEIAAGNIRRPQAPRNLGLSLIAWDSGVSRRNLAAPEVPESDWSI